MDVSLVRVDPNEASRKLAEYQQYLGAGHAGTEYQRIAQGYEIAARGGRLLRLSLVFEGCPRDERGRPRLAIARADRRQVKVTVGDRADEFDARDRFSSWGRGGRLRDGLIPVMRPFVPAGLATWRQEKTLANPSNANYYRNLAVAGYSLVPIVPPDLLSRRRAQFQQGRLFILWEVERWADDPIRSNPDRDPYLLRRVSDDMFEVLAEWDLTPLEMAIMQDRARS